jgi:hypothetical protein
VLTTAEEQCLQQHLHRLERRLARYSQAISEVRLAPDVTRRRVQVDLRVRLRPSGAHLIGHREAGTADEALESAVDDVLRELLERHAVRHHGQPSYGIHGQRLRTVSPRQGGSPIL